jgi:hypothetical protein
VNINLYSEDNHSGLAIDVKNSFMKNSKDFGYPMASPSTNIATDTTSNALSKHLSKKINERSFDTNLQKKMGNPNITSSITNMFGLPPSGQNSSQKQPNLEKKRSANNGIHNSQELMKKILK